MWCSSLRRFVRSAEEQETAGQSYDQRITARALLRIFAARQPHLEQGSVELALAAAGAQDAALAIVGEDLARRALARVLASLALERLGSRRASGVEELCAGEVTAGVAQAVLLRVTAGQALALDHMHAFAAALGVSRREGLAVGLVPPQRLKAFVARRVATAAHPRVPRALRVTRLRQANPRAVHAFAAERGRKDILLCGQQLKRQLLTSPSSC